MGGPGSGRKKGAGSKKGQTFSAGSTKGSRARVAAQKAIGRKKLIAAGYKPDKSGRIRIGKSIMRDWTK